MDVDSILAIETLDGRTHLHDSRGRFKETLVNDVTTGPSQAGNHRCAMSWAPKPMRLYFAKGPKVMTWDATLRKTSETFEMGSRICSLAVNADDVLLAVSQNTGSLDVVNRSTGVSLRMEKPTSMVMAKLEYSTFNKSILGGTGNDGVLRLWDSAAATGSSSLYHSFNTTHEGSISGMAFSPFNRYLICTTGMDKRYALYDVEKKNVVKTTVTDYALTSVSFKNDGISMAFGTAEGKILLYDLRSASRPISIVDTKINGSISAIQFQGKQPSVASSGLKRHQTTNGHTLKRQNSEGSKSSILSTKDSSSPFTTPLGSASITATGGAPGLEEVPKFTRPTFTRPAPIKTATIPSIATTTNVTGASSYPTLNRLAATNAKPTREVQSASVAAGTSKGIFDLFSPTKRPSSLTTATTASEKPPMRPRRPTAPSSTTVPASVMTTTTTTPPASTSTTAATTTAIPKGHQHHSVPTTPKREGSGIQSGGSYPNSRTTSPYSFQIMQSRSPSGESSSSSSSVNNTPPGSPPPGTTGQSSTLNESHKTHHHYQNPFAAGSLSQASPSQSSRAKRRKSLGTLLASGGAASPRPEPSDPMAEERMEILKGQIVDRVRNVLLDHEPLHGSSSRTTTKQGHQQQQPESASSRPSAQPSLHNNNSRTTMTVSTAVPFKDLWMQVGMEGASSTSAAVAGSRTQKSTVLGKSALPITSASVNNTDVLSPSSSMFAAPPPSFPTTLTSSFPTKILEGVIEGCLMEFRAGIRNDIQNMHLELLRQFQIQKMELEGLLKQYTDLKEVKEENERLIEENRKLRLNY
ncbi:Protein nedd1 [Gryganskiella cystojenkinii]|nr:Protein nedd1 [Gryganskiella cystojenkinii]